MPHAAPPILPNRSPRMLQWFARYCHWYARRHFEKVLLANPPMNLFKQDEPIIVYMNHPSWWDPIMGLLVCNRFFMQRRNHAVIDAKALEQYRFFKKLGFFGVEQDSSRGGAQFLRTALAIVNDGPHVLWLTAQGRFADPRERPIVLQPGLAHLVRRMNRGFVLPLAFEYPFGEESTPCALMQFGTPIAVQDTCTQSIDVIQQRLTQALQNTMNALAQRAIERQTDDMLPLIASGKAGVGGVYDLWRRLRARWRGEHFDPHHASVRESNI